MRASLLLVIVGVHMTGPALQAELITMEISGPFTRVDDPESNLGVSVGDRWSITYEFDSLAPPKDSMTYTTFYDFTSVEVRLGQVVYANVWDNAFLAVTNGPPGSDVYELGAMPEYAAPEMLITLVDFSATVFDSEALPLTPPSLDRFDLSTSEAGFYDFNGPYFSVGGSIDSWILIPEPTTLALLALGSIPLLRRRRQSN